MDSLQFYNGPPEKVPAPKRKKLVQKPHCNVDGLQNRATKVQENPLKSKIETNITQLQSRAEPKPITLREANAEQAEGFTLINILDVGSPNAVGSLDSRTVADQQQASDILESASKSASTCNELSGIERVEKERLESLDSEDRSNVGQINMPACEPVSSCAIEGSERTTQRHDDVECSFEKSAFPLQAQNARPLMSHSGATLPRHEPDHPFLNYQKVASCEGCTFKDGQIFALVRILHSLHSNQLQTCEGKVVLKPPKRARRTAEVSRTKRHHKAQGARSQVQRSKEIEKDANNTPTHQMQPHTGKRTRSGRVSKVTQKILYSSV